MKNSLRTWVDKNMFYEYLNKDGRKRNDGYFRYIKVEKKQYKRRCKYYNQFHCYLVYRKKIVKKCV